MPSRLQTICDAIIEATWLAALVVIPIFFNVYSQRVFEPDKISLLRSLALIALVAWVVKSVDGFRRKQDQTKEGNNTERPLWRRPLVWAVAALALAYLLSSLLSVAPRQSFLGSYQRLQGTFTMYSYMVFFLVVLDTLRTRAQWQRLQYAVILTSIPIALYGILQHFSLDSLPWGGDTTERVAANMGNAIFLAAYLIMAVPLTVERLITAGRRMLLDEAGNATDALMAGALLFILILQIVAILFTQSRGPWLGLAAGAYVFLLLVFTSLRQQAKDQGRLRIGEVGKGIGMGLAGLLLIGLGFLAVLRLPGVLGGLILVLTLLGAAALYLIPLFNRRGWRWLWLSVVTQAVVVAGILVLLNVPNSPLAGFRDVPYVGRLAQLMETESGTGRVRVLIWEGVIDMLSPHEALTYPDGVADALNPARTLIGYGPESMWVAYNRFYVPELGDLEARNASPDRSHNETFDSLVITGLLGFIAYILLFTGIFYFALRWLGLIQRRADQIFFVGLGVAGGVIGALIPWIVGSPQYAGVGIPLGFIVGVMVYITYAAFRGSEDRVELDRRRLLIIALLATVLAHFVEIHFGIAIVATRTYFFILAAALITIGIGQLQLADEEAIEQQPEPVAPASGKRRQRSRRQVKRQQKLATGLSLWRNLLPYTAVVTLALFVISWDYLSNQSGLTSAFAIFIRSWTTHLDGNTLVSGPGALWIVLFTLVVGLILGLGETWKPRDSGNDVLMAVLSFGGATLIVWLFYGLMQSRRLLPMPNTLTLEARADIVAGHIVNFYIWLALLVLSLAAVLYFAWPRPAVRWGFRPVLALVSGGVLLVLALYLVVDVNLNLVRADTYFKLGQNTDTRREWPASLVFYDRAVALAPREDHYRLFYGRALLESARDATDATQQLAFLDRARVSLETARQLNPLNTDHSANLARYYATRASALTDPAARDESLRQASASYETATSLSPNAAHLQNEWGTVLLQMGDIDGARARFAHSLELDANYSDTYLRLAQLETQQEDWEAALTNYQMASELAPNDIRPFSGMGFVLSRLGRTEQAIDANLAALAISPTDLSTLQNLAVLYQQAGDLQESLRYAQQAQQIAPDAQKANLDAFIQQIQRQIDGN
ncbi:MAG: tetratricopeptide repeat protein [Caldilineales bacterium]|nr:tetratricopeptide repeat protein [Caldilineales bacterium]